MDEELKKLFSLDGVEVYPTGSRFICDPAPTNTDEDYLIFCQDKESYNNFTCELIHSFWKLCGGNYTGDKKDDFEAFRKGVYNLIVSYNLDFVKRWVLANDVCQSLNLLNKNDRVRVFNLIRVIGK